MLVAKDYARFMKSTDGDRHQLDDECANVELDLISKDIK